MDRPSVITFVNEDYIAVGQNWLKAVIALNTGATIRIIALDTATRDAFPADMVLYQPFGLPIIPNLWQYRIQVLRKFLEAGQSVIHSDADAIWVQDPFPVINACSCDMVFSQGTIWPPDVHKQHGIVLCCGFFYLMNTEPVLQFMKAAEERVAQDKDNQITINRMLNEAGIIWENDTPYTIPFRDTAFTASQKIIPAKAGFSPSVAVLPHHMFPRVLEQMNSDVIVAHPLSPKKCADKIVTLTKLGLWK